MDGAIDKIMMNTFLWFEHRGNMIDVMWHKCHGRNVLFSCFWVFVKC